MEHDILSIVLASTAPQPARLSLLQPAAVNATLAEVRQCRIQGKKPVSLMPGGEGTLRISFASGGDILTQGPQRLRRVLEQLS